MVTLIFKRWCDGHFHKYKCLWGVGEGKGRDLSHQERVSHIYTLKLSYNRIFILYIKKNTQAFLKKKKNKIRTSKEDDN